MFDFNEYDGQTKEYLYGLIFSLTSNRVTMIYYGINYWDFSMFENLWLVILKEISQHLLKRLLLSFVSMEK